MLYRREEKDAALQLCWRTWDKNSKTELMKYTSIFLTAYSIKSHSSSRACPSWLCWVRCRVHNALLSQGLFKQTTTHSSYAFKTYFKTLSCLKGKLQREIRFHRTTLLLSAHQIQRCRAPAVSILRETASLTIHHMTQSISNLVFLGSWQLFLNLPVKILGP